MGRPRRSNFDLPPGVYLNGQTYYYVTKARVWLPLGKDRDAALAKHEAMVIRAGWPPAFLSLLYKAARQNAAKRGITFALSREEFKTLVRESNGCCTLTGIPFSFERHNGSRLRPWAPSIDRIDSKLGYHPDNCRLICAYANVALNEFGVELLTQIAAAIRKRARRNIRKSPIRLGSDTIRTDVNDVAC